MANWRHMELEETRSSPASQKTLRRGGNILELEKQYSPSCWSRRMDKDAVIEAHVKELIEGTQRSQASTQMLTNVPYGAGEGESFDVYLPDKDSGAFPLLIYVHGGYWQFLSKEESGFLAAPLAAKGIAVAVINYDIAPKGHMDLIVSQVTQSIAFISRQYPQINGIYLCGHSAGAHLAAMALSTDWSEYGVTPDIKGAVLVSGLYDLLPIIPTYVNQPLQMTEAVALRNSPMQYMQAVKSSVECCRMVIVVAEHDSPEFQRQSREYFQSLKELGLNVSFHVVENTDHFDVIERLCREDYVLTQMISEMILGS